MDELEWGCVRIEGGVLHPRKSRTWIGHATVGVGWWLFLGDREGLERAAAAGHGGKAEGFDYSHEAVKAMMEVR